MISKGKAFACQSGGEQAINPTSCSEDTPSQQTTVEYLE